MMNKDVGGGDKLIFYEGDTKLMGVLPSPPPNRENLVMGTWPFLKNLNNWSGDKVSF